MPEIVNTKPQIGKIVGFVLPDGHNRAGKVIPAIVTRLWGKGNHPTLQLTPFPDVANDGPILPSQCSSVPFDGGAEVGRTWHYLD